MNQFLFLMQFESRSKKVMTTLRQKNKHTARASNTPDQWDDSDSELPSQGEQLLEPPATPPGGNSEGCFAIFHDKPLEREKLSQDQSLGDQVRRLQAREQAERQQIAEKNAARASKKLHASMQRAEMQRAIALVTNHMKKVVDQLVPPKPSRYSTQTQTFATNIVAKFITNGNLRKDVIAYRGDLAFFNGITPNAIIERFLVYGLNVVRPKPRGRERRYDLSEADTRSVRSHLGTLLRGPYAPLLDGLVAASKMCPKNE